ncbi:MAG TPA: sulfatase-like hydrolase/transferase [Polyangiaceae bacterium]
MRYVAQRFLFAGTGGALGALLVALVEARGASVASALPYEQLLVSDWAVLTPVSLVLAFGVATVGIVLEPRGARAPTEHLAALRHEDIFARSRTAALVPLSVFATFAILAASAHVARSMFADGPPAAVGLSLSLSMLALALGAGAVTLALVAPLRRALAYGGSRFPWLLDPTRTGAVALGVGLLALVWGIRSGDTGGDGPGPGAIFGVLKRSELDLRPVVDLVSIALAAYLVPIALAQRERMRLRSVAAAAALFIPCALTVREARAMNGTPTVARALERHAPLGKIALAAVRRATDRDHDGASPYFGGGDCDDHDRSRSPFAVDVPGNGVDEDCDGVDMPAPVPTFVPPPKKAPPVLPKDLNLIFITVDTLRPDVGFMGYPKPTTPNLDALAARSVVFDDAYAMASYTGKSIGPLLTGKYPSETERDGGHFNKYGASNVLVTERLHAANIRTLGAASHWYFAPWSGLSQGMDTWDLSAQPADGQGDSDTSVTSGALSDAAIRLLKHAADPDDAGEAKRFFLWLHYFDPHAQYMAHEGAPDFLGDGRGGVAAQRAAYDGEVWFTDKHIGRVLDFVAQQPWADHTAIVVTSDHGEAFGEHNMSWHGMDVWEPLVRVPLLVYVPGLTAHHVDVKRSHVDLVPTLLDVMSVAQPAPGELSGQSLVDDLVGEGPFVERDVYIDMPVGPNTLMRKAVVTGKTPGMKLIYAGGKNYQLYDLAADPEEKNDLSQDEAAMKPVLESFQAARSRVKEIDVPPDAP